MERGIRAMEKKLIVFGAVLIFSHVLLLSGTPICCSLSSPLPVPLPSGNVYYVSPAGNNSNPGTITQPWATPGYGTSQLQPGDTLVI